MANRVTRIIINRHKRPEEQNLNQELQWLCDSLGLFGSRDKDKSRFRTFLILLKSVDSEGLTSDQISDKVGLSRGTVVHHLHSLMNSGLVISERSRYMIRVDNLSELIDEVERDILKTISELKEAASDIDKRLNL